jgi:hypothetical protein
MLLAVAVVASFGGVGARVVMAAGSKAAISERVSDSAAASAFGCFFCGNGGAALCYSDEHGDSPYWAPQNFQAPNGPHSTCVNQPCENWHTSYGAVEFAYERIATVAEASAKGDVDAVISALQEGWLLYSPERSALQMFSNDGAVMQHVPLEGHVAESVAAAFGPESRSAGK